MVDQPQRIVAATLSDTLANLAYMFPDETPASQPTSQNWMEARISYHGPATGELRFRCTRPFAEKLAANLLGIEPHHIPARVGADDALGEFVNVLCGQLVSNLYATREVFRLSVPDVRPLPRPPAEGEDPDLIRLQVEGCPVELTCSIGELCASAGRSA